jgi:hypothetical protein
MTAPGADGSLQLGERKTDDEGADGLALIENGHGNLDLFLSGGLVHLGGALPAVALHRLGVLGFAGMAPVAGLGEEGDLATLGIGDKRLGQPGGFLRLQERGGLVTGEAAHDGIKNTERLPFILGDIGEFGGQRGILGGDGMNDHGIGGPLLDLLEGGIDFGLQLRVSFSGLQRGGGDKQGGAKRQRGKKTKGRHGGDKGWLPYLYRDTGPALEPAG